jgi:hypothetical protein
MAPQAQSKGEGFHAPRLDDTGHALANTLQFLFRCAQVMMLCAWQKAATTRHAHLQIRFNKWFVLGPPCHHLAEKSWCLHNMAIHNWKMHTQTFGHWQYMPLAASCRALLLLEPVQYSQQNLRPELAAANDLLLSGLPKMVQQHTTQPMYALPRLLPVLLATNTQCTWCKAPNPC